MNTAENIRREYERIAALGREQPDKLLIYPIGAGYHVLYNIPRFSRHTWYIPKYIRPYETPTFLALLPQARALVVLQVPESADAMKVFDNPLVFPPEFATEVRRRMGTPIAVGKDCWMIPLVEPKN